MRLYPLAAAAALLTAASASAQDSGPVTPPPPGAEPLKLGGDTLTIGAGVARVPSYEGSDTSRWIPAGAARGSVSGFDFATRGTKLYVDLARGKPGPGYDFQLGPVVSVNLDRSSGIDDVRVEALGKRKVALELGGYVGFGRTGVLTSDYDTLSASVSYVRDVTNIHDSYVITPEISYGTPLSRKAFVGVSASAIYAGGGYARTYFSVDAPGALRSGLPVFNARRGWKNYSVSGLASYALTGDLLGGLSLVAGGSYSRLLNDFAASPVTRVAGDRNQWFGTVGLAYTF